MNCLFSSANEFVRQSDWKDLSALKFCTLAAGLLIGMTVPKRSRRFVMVLALLVFLAAFVPLMLKYVRILLCKDYEN